MGDLDTASPAALTGDDTRGSCTDDPTLAALIGALSEKGVKVRVLDRARHPGAGGPAVHTVYVECELGGTLYWGTGVGANDAVALCKGVASAIGRAHPA
ncbi:hypothetical protein Ssi03_37640 [Sphaerisporangium siamense]|uniref:2-isopropylmalate synthase LeuA allosteric (dimerisation) domain-containing protein n=1 Tax=Sphaerisporangium siamense TaxID=795645 RepID=A0A7W7GAP9_9ACTN|nr:hypothetical protein [Sphaerisporangium siamense]MBB4701649.1 hypothetical protein [Sphaerisporangium siamense]GII85774.1 hypothetical protein Ssi03_37640 [Sphaerisporangium siamense]